MNRFTHILAASAIALALSAAPALAADGNAGSKKGSTKVKGHYAGQNAAGHAISFDVVGPKAKPTVENFAVDVDTECWNDFNLDGESDTLLAHITGFGSKLKKTGTFDIYYAPDDDTEFEFNGVIADGKAKIDVIVGGTFTLLGIPDLLGPYQCDSWGEVYKAKRR